MSSNGSLASTLLTDVQTKWFIHVLNLGGLAEESSVYRALAKDIPADFDPYRDLDHRFWSYNRLTVFAVYKVNRDHAILRNLHSIFCCLRDTFALSDRASVTSTEISESTRIDLSDVNFLFEKGFVGDFWISYRGHNQYGHPEYSAEKKSQIFCFDGVKGISRIRGYRDVDTQLENQWQDKKTGPVVYPPEWGLGNVGSIYDAALGATETKPDVDAEAGSRDEESDFEISALSNWQELKLRVLDLEVIQIEIGVSVTKAHFTDLKFLDRKSFKPNFYWRLLIGPIAEKDGKFTTEDIARFAQQANPPLRTPPRQILYKLRAHLRKAFGLEQDPFFSPDEMGGDDFQTKFSIRSKP